MRVMQPYGYQLIRMGTKRVPTIFVELGTTQVIVEHLLLEPG